MQAVLWEPISRRVLAHAGLKEGMTVLDIGTGTGFVAMLAAEMVGPSGKVIGIDRRESIVEHARQQAKRNNLPNLSFQIGATYPEERASKFDLVTGRLMAGYQPDRIEFFRQASSMVKPGGTIAFLEAAWNLCGTWTSPAIPVYDKLVQQFMPVIRTLGFDADLGSHLIQTFQHAGLSEPQVSAELLVSGPRSGIIDYMFGCFEMVFAQARDAEIDIPGQVTLKKARKQVQRAAEAGYVQFNGPCVVGAWTTIR